MPDLLETLIVNCMILPFRRIPFASPILPGMPYTAVTLSGRGL
jgi:hypothetical protein